MTENHTSPENVDSRVFVQSILGQRVVCTLSDGRTAMGRLMCVDRLKNLILADCICEQQICSTDYTPPSASIVEPVYQRVQRPLQQAMVPGTHLVAVHLCDRAVYDAALLRATVRTG